MQSLIEPTSGSHRSVRRTRSSLVRSLPIAAVVLLLAACSVVPPQSVTDPLGLDSEQLAVTFEDAAAGPAGANLGAQAVTGTFSGGFEFEDWDVNLPVSPGTLSNAVSIASASLEPATGAPAEIVLSEAILTVRLWHGAASYEDAADADRVEHVLEAPGAITLTRGTCAMNDRCSYSYGGDDLAFGTINLSGSPLRNLVMIATSEPTPNLGSVSLTVQGEPDTLAGKTLNVRLAAAEGTVGF